MSIYLDYKFRPAVFWYCTRIKNSVCVRARHTAQCIQFDRHIAFILMFILEENKRDLFSKHQWNSEITTQCVII